MGATPIRIDAVTEAHIGAVVFGHNAPGTVGKIFGGPVVQAGEVFLVVFDLFKIGNAARAAEAVRRINLRTSTFGLWTEIIHSAIVPLPTSAHKVGCDQVVSHSWTANIDFIHVLSYVIAAATAGRKWAEGWPVYVRWIEWLWQGQPERIIVELAQRQAELGVAKPVGRRNAPTAFGGRDPHLSAKPQRQDAL